MCVIFAKKSWVATKLGGAGAKLGGCCILDSLQFRQQAVTDPVQQTVAVVKTAADECVHQCLRSLQSQRRSDHL